MGGWIRRTVFGTALALGTAASASAAVNIFYHAGGWDAFNGTGDDGQPMCGAGSYNPRDGRSFSLRFPLNSNDVLFIASKPSWNVPNGTAMPVVMQIGLDRPWTAQAEGNGQRIQWTLGRDAMGAFDAQFRGASSMTVSFPNGSEQPWVIALNGSTAVSNAMGRCINEMARRAAAQAAPQPPQGETQPYGGDQNPPPAPPPSQPAVPAQSGGQSNPPQDGTQPNAR